MKNKVKSAVVFAGINFFGLMALAQQSTKPPAPYGAIPSERQLKWHETEMYCLIHFTPTTFQNKEWGYGDADPAIFNPAQFDAGQIIAAAAAGGFKGIVMVAKHHDGFALWPTKTAAYNISESPWRSGKGDMVREFQQAAQKNSMKFGIYCSPWDRNNPAYGTPEYITIYRDQLKELYSNYGPLFMSWHDGANGGDGYYGGRKEVKKVDQSVYYDWMNTWAITRKLQPGASIFSDIGPDVRWVGNEKGMAPETAWSTIDLKGKDGKTPMPGYMDDENLGSGTRNGKQWLPFEGDVPLRPGWFYHPEQDGQVKTVAQLFEIYCSSVGRGGSLDLGLSPNTDGLLHANDVAALKDFGAYLKQVFAENVAKNAKITASNVRGKQKAFDTQNLQDNDRYSYWATDDQVHQASLVLDLPAEKPINLVQIRENIKLGQRVDSIKLENYIAGEWKTIGKATSIGANRLIRLPETITAKKLRLTIFAPVSPALSEVGLYLAPEIKTKAIAKVMSAYAKNDWKIISPVSSDDLKKAIDQLAETSAAVTGTNELILDMGYPHLISAFGYLPARDEQTAGRIEKFEYLYSEDGKQWTPAASGEFSNIKANPILQRTTLKAPVTARFVMLRAIGVTGGGQGFRLAEIEVFQ